MMHLGRLFLAATLLTFLSACPPRSVLVDGRSVSLEDAARMELQTARDKVSAGEYVRAAELFEAVARRYPETAEADEALIEAGRSWEMAKQPIKARAAYEGLLSRYPRSDKVAEAKQRIEALGGSKDAELAQAAILFESLPEERKYEEALRLAAEAEEAGNGPAAFLWREEALRRSPDFARDEAELTRLLSALSTEQVERIAKELGSESPARAAVDYRVAMIQQERRDWDKLEDALRDFIAAHPSHARAVEARELLAKIENRGQVAPRKVGVVLPLSGQYRIYGQQLKAGIDLAFKGSGIQVIAKDSLGEAEGAAAAVESLLFEEHVIAILGGVLTAEADAAALKADELGIPFVGFSRSEGFTGESEWIFRDMLTNSAIVDALVEFAMEERKMSRFAVLYPEIPYGQEMRDLFWDRVEEKGGQMKAVEGYAQETTTFAEPVQKLVGRFVVENRGEYQRNLQLLRTEQAEDIRAERAKRPRVPKNTPPTVDFQALFLPDQWKTVALVAPALAFEDVITNWCQKWDLQRIEKTTKRPVKPVMLLGGNLWNHPDLPRRAGKYINCSVFVDGFYAQSARPETMAFVEQFTAANGRAPFLLEAYGFDAGLVVRNVVEHAQPTERRGFIEAMMTVKDVPGPMGPITVTEEREIVHPLYFLTIDDGMIREAELDREDGSL